MTWGLAILGLLAARLWRMPEEPHPADGDGSVPLAWGVLIRARGAALALVLVIGVLRVLAVLGVPLGLAFLLKGEGRTNAEIGLPQTLFLAGVGGGSLVCALFVRRSGERRVLWLLPLLVVPLLWLVPRAGTGLMLLAELALAGLLLGATLPILVSYGQQLLPEGQRTASSITMGVTYGFGGMIVAMAMAVSSRLHWPELPFAAFAVACLLSSLLCAWLPDPRLQASSSALIPQPR
jgi:FSR family fosmidomycin resistance protein-like MFS transporter